MDDGRLPGTSSSNRSTSAQEDDRENSPSRLGRRPSSRDGAVPAGTIQPKSYSPTRHPPSLLSNDQAGPSNYASRSPRSPVGSPRQRTSPQPKVLSKSPVDEEAGSRKRKRSSSDGATYGGLLDVGDVVPSERKSRERDRSPYARHLVNGWPEDHKASGRPNGLLPGHHDDEEGRLSPSPTRQSTSTNGLYGSPLPYPVVRSPNGHRNGHGDDPTSYQGRRSPSRDVPNDGQPSFTTPSKTYSKAEYFQNGHRFTADSYSTPARQSRTPSPPSTIDLTTPHKRRLQANDSPEDSRSYLSPAVSGRSEMASPYRDEEPPRKRLFADVAQRSVSSSSASSPSGEPQSPPDLHPSPSRSPLPPKVSFAEEVQVMKLDPPATSRPHPQHVDETISPPIVTEEAVPPEPNVDVKPPESAQDAHPPTTEDVDMLPGLSTVADSLVADEEGDKKGAAEPETMDVVTEAETEKTVEKPASLAERTPEQLRDMIKILQARYKYLDRQWRLQTERIDRVLEARKKRLAPEKNMQTPVTPGTGFLFSDVDSPAVPTRSSRRSAASVFFGDAVRSDLEMEAILEKIQMEESQDATFRSRYTTANIPDMDIVTDHPVQPKVDVSDEIVTNPEEFYGVHASPDRWTSEEEEIFATRYAQTPKQFGEIAEGLEHKTPEQCVEYYYLNKRVLDFRGKSTTGKRKSGRKAGKGKGRSLLADIQAAEEEGQKKPRREKAKEKVAEDTPPAEEETTTSDAESPGHAATQLPEAEYQDSPMEVDSADMSTADVTLRPETKAPDLPIMPLPGTGSYATTSIMYASPNDPRSKRSKLGLEVDPASSRRRSATSSYWSVQEKLTAVTSNEAHPQDWERIAADVGTKSATQIRNFFQNQTAESLAELSSKAKAGLGPAADDTRMQVDAPPEPVSRSHTSTPQRWAPLVEKEPSAPSPVKSEYASRLEQPIILPTIPPPFKPEPPPSTVENGAAAHHVDAPIGGPRPFHQLPPISSLPFDSPTAYGERFAAGKGRVPLSALLTDDGSRSPTNGPNGGVRDWFGEPKRLLPHELEPRPSSERFDWRDRRSDPFVPPRPLSVDPIRDYRGPSREEYGAYPVDYPTARPSSYARAGDEYYHSRPSFAATEAASERGYRSVDGPFYEPEPAREAAWRTRPLDDYPAQHKSPVPPGPYFQDRLDAYPPRPDVRTAYPPYFADRDRSLPPLTTDYDRRPSPGPSSAYAYPTAQYHPRAPSPGYSYRDQSTSAYAADYEARRLPPLTREYSTYRTPPAADNPLPSGYYDGRPPSSDYYDRPSAPPLSQHKYAWPAEQERPRYPSEYPAEYQHDRRYYSR